MSFPIVKKLYLNLAIENTLKSPIYVSWRNGITSDTYRLFTEEKPVQVKSDAGSSEQKTTLVFGVSDDQPTWTTDKYQIVVYAGYEADCGGLKVNDKATVQFDLSKSKDGDANVVLVTQPKGKMEVLFILQFQFL